MDNKQKLILVTGATGIQGGAVARALLKKGNHKVRILARNVNSVSAQTLILDGVEAVEGNFDDVTSLENAMHGVDAVFSMTNPDMTDAGNEQKQGNALIQAALKKGVKQFVHTSVARAGTHDDFPEWESGYWSKSYWIGKWEVEENIRTAGFSSWTILKPAFMMDNFAQPKSTFMFPHLQQGEVKTAMLAETSLDLIAADDIAAFAIAAFDNPEKFNKKSIKLASESLTMKEVAEILASVTGESIISVSLSPQEAEEQGILHGLVRSQEWNNNVGYTVNINSFKPYNIKLTSFNEWAEKYKNDIKVNRV
ncbi:NmrA/HSCARG family protein [Priestia megaterium]|uniref:NmrA/HSCARG family protein n=1 Tax=Priestia megaterium TaxID=1404 RepID=UPI002B24EBF5|nr:NmrA/HSCARG family protein [Priestia megaterium]MEB2268264.1 NmrA/HSCARG family protein [Priestia megaterium]